MFNWRVPNQRKPGQTFVGVQISDELMALIETGRRKLGPGMDRSQFLRDAIREKLETLDIHAPAASVVRPDRARPFNVELGPDELKAAETPPTPGEPAAEAPPKPVRYPKSKKPKP